MSHRRLLVAIVDDEGSFRTALSRLFRSAGIDVETFASGFEFLESLKVKRPDCVVLDLHLPGLSGLDIQENLNEMGLSLPTVIITGYDRPGVAERALASGVFAYLEKPLDEERLLNAVTSAARAGQGVLS